MLGAIAGDIVGSRYEGAPIKTTDFELFGAGCGFTDDSVLTVAVAAAILDGRPYAETILEYGRRYPWAGYGASFHRWLASPEPRPYGSWGNGSAMRVSPVGFAFETEAQVLDQARRCAACTHDHPEGVKGAQAVALAVFLARSGADKPTIREQVQQRFGYDLSQALEEIRPAYRFDISCQGSVPQAILCFLEGHDWESSVRNAVSLGGDSDTMACIAGGIAEAFHGPLPAVARARVERTLTTELWQVGQRFCARFLPPGH